ncbi:transport and Golgi organization protein 1 homolog isoform X1 [Canis lupus baileyi]|nr:transport and Golgi organization protein 1 homolog isoform X1 [Canis lupus dingo]XP_025272125.1 transport and Golgi organization protein 1 homolog isoform X1 [Canis lupus dingo]XP_025272126.1 transport and Golgi organization protein 1 homolog isoform X1 [Canis lupus dingo]XP_038524919.1 transport and Golgi organization protein 1 homolog isoform X1 [Canis lupus familiaris]XP_038524920.1 transport and Golgi organization protein 1 homolog isoform X1 [Canis lupus familiaris]XP_038524921.1 trans|eukprot:XP_022275727.1 melanoma inhibitory activity protein 3-like isoform X1 [Canis lupus familiaris]
MFLSDEDPKLKENIKTVEQLSENLNDTHQCAHTNMQSEKKKNVKNQDKLQDVFEDPELRVLRSKKCDLEESKKVLEDKCNALSSVKTMKEAELKQLKKKVDTLVEMVEFYEQKRMAAAEKLEKTHYELVAKKNQFSTKEEFFKVATEEIDRYKQQVQEMQEQLQESELTFRLQIAIHEKNAQDNWVKAQIWEWEIAQQSREKAYLKHRLAILEGKMLPERHRRQELIPGRPEMQIPQRRESRPVPEKNSSTIPKKNPEMAKKALFHISCWTPETPISSVVSVAMDSPCSNRRPLVRIVSDLKTSWNSNNLAVQRAYLEKMSDLPKGQSVSPSNPVPCALSLLLSS